MEFWGVEVKPGSTVKCQPGGKYVHVSQASLGETKDKGSENVPLFVKINDQKLVIGTLSVEKCAQINMDLVFEKEFELSHSSKSTSVYFCGYKNEMAEEDDTSGDDIDSEQEFQLGQKVNGKPEVKEEQAKPAAGKPNSVKVDTSAKAKAKMEVPLMADKKKADEDDGDEDDGDDDDDLDDDDSSDDEDLPGIGDDSDDEDSEEDDATPKKAETDNKRPAGSASKTPVPEKKAKLISPVGNQKAGTKSVHTATPYPNKLLVKISGKNDKSKQQTPKSSGSVTCKSCSRTFNSENALESHNKAKHPAAN